MTLCRRLNNFYFLIHNRSSNGWGAISSADCRNALACMANPDRMPRRHLRLLRMVARIELRECPDESTALARESELLRTVRPRFNRAGTWPAPPRFFAWRCVEQHLQLAVAETADTQWRFHSPLGGTAFVLRAVLARLLWVAVNPGLGFSALPVGWFQGKLDPEIAIHCGPLIEPAAFNLEKLLSGQTTEFCEWIRTQLPADLHPFDKAAVEADLEMITDGLALVRREQHPCSRDEPSP